MTIFRDRLRAELSRYQHDDDFTFRVRSRSLKRLAFEVAQSVGYSASQANTYAAACMLAGIEEDGRSSLIDRIVRKLGVYAQGIDPVTLERRLRAINAEVYREMMAE